MQFLKQNTSVTVKIGPFVDDEDGKTAETELTIEQSDVRLSKNGGDIAQKHDASTCTHDELGIYDCSLDATDTDTLGRLQLWVHKSGALPVWHEFMVLPANVYDAFFGSDKLEVDVLQLGGDEQSATDLKDFADSGYDPTTHKIEACKVNDDMRGTDNAALASVCTEERLSELDSGNIPSDIDAIKGKTDKLQFTTDNDVRATLDGEKVTLTDETEAQIDAIEEDTDEIQGKLPINNIMGSSVKTSKDDEIDAIKAQTDKLQFNVDNDVKATLAGEKVSLSDTTESQIDNIENNVTNHDQYKADVSDLALETTVQSIKNKTDKLQFNIDNDVKATLDNEKVSLTDATEAQIDSIEEDTNEIQSKLPTENIMGSSVKSSKDDEINAIKAKTDLLPSGIPKNKPLNNFSFLMVLSSDHITPATGKTVTAEISKDGGAFEACENDVEEIGSGVYKINLTQAEMNHDVVVLKFSAEDCDQRTITIMTSD